jgi:hypothetical protein
MGRPRKCHVTASGEVIEGLYKRPDGRFAASGRKNVTFGTIEVLAIKRFREWQKTKPKLEKWQKSKLPPLPRLITEDEIEAERREAADRFRRSHRGRE